MTKKPIVRGIVDDNDFTELKRLEEVGNQSMSQLVARSVKIAMPELQRLFSPNPFPNPTHEAPGRKKRKTAA